MGPMHARRLGPLVLVVVSLLALPARADRQYRGGAAATAHPLATEAAMEMLDKGGNAVDAAVAAAFTLAVVGPYHSGIGGGGFALVHRAAGHETKVLDFREVAPKGATRDMYLKDGKVVPNLSLDFGPSVAVPGAVAGYLELLATYGKLKPKVVLAPAIRAAKKGFYVSYTYQRLATMRTACLRQDAEASRLFLEKNAEGVFDVPKTGKLIVQPELAKTLELIAAKGKPAFYSGKIARALVDAVKRTGGTLSLEDLASYKTRWRAPLEGSYRGHKILTMPPPSAGGLAILQVLGILEQKYPKGLAFHDPEQLHTFAEAMRLAYLDRFRYLGRPGVRADPAREAALARAPERARLADRPRPRALVAEAARRARRGAGSRSGPRAAGPDLGEEHHPRLGDRQGRQRGLAHHHGELRVRLVPGARRHGRAPQRPDGRLRHRARSPERLRPPRQRRERDRPGQGAALVDVADAGVPEGQAGRADDGGRLARRLDDPDHRAPGDLERDRPPDGRHPRGRQRDGCTTSSSPTSSTSSGSRSIRSPPPRSPRRATSSPRASSGATARRC